MTRSAQIRTAAAALTLVTGVSATLTAAEESLGPQRPIAMEQLGGTFLTVTPQIEYQSALLRVSGPNHYALTRLLPAGAPIVVDLLAAPEAESVIELRTEEARTEPPAFLVDGLYLYEVVLHLGQDEVALHTGDFFVTGGVVLSREEVRAGLSQMRHELIAAAAGEGDQGQLPSTAGVDAEDYVYIGDISPDGLTWLALDSDNAPQYTTFEHWGLVNSNGNLSIQECGSNLPSTGCQATRLFFEQDTGGEIGINTSTPQGRLHVVGSGNQLILDDNAGSRHGFQQSASSLVIRNELAQTQVKIADDAPSNALVLEDTGVGIGTSTPAAELHVVGAAMIEGDVALGSSRTIKHEVERVDTAAVLAAICDLPLYAWKYRDDPVQAPHVGPMAEDVYGAFSIGRDDKHLSPADSAGLALAAIQGIDDRLDRELSELRTRNAELAAENHDLRERLMAIEQHLADLATGPGGTE